MREYKNYNKEILVDLLLNRLSIDDFVDLDDPNVMWDQLYNLVYGILSVMCPFRKYRQSSTSWISADIYRAMRYCDSFVNWFKATQKSLYMTLAKRQFNIVNSMIESAKRNYILKTLNNNSSVPNKFWGQINVLLKGEKSCSSQPNLVDPVTKTDVPKGNVVYDNNEIFNCYDMIENIFDILEDPPMLEDITAYVDDIDLSKSSCVDEISTNICKDLLKHAPRYFLTIFRKSFETDIFPCK